MAKILLIDDHAILRAGLKLLINKQPNMQVVGEAESGEAAINIIPEIKPDIVIMDISMPGTLNGISATAEIKKQWHKIKVIILTMHDDVDVLFKVIEAGGSGYVLKNTAGKDLIDAINKVYRGKTFVTPHITNLILAGYMEKIKSGQADKYETLTKREKEILSFIQKLILTFESMNIRHI